MNQISILSQLIFELSLMEPLDNVLRTLQQKCLRVFDYRINQYFKTINQRDWVEFDDVIMKISTCILEIKNLPEEQQDFKLASLCAATLEANTTNLYGRGVNQGSKVFKLTFSLLEKNYDMIKLPKDHPVILHCIKNLKKNKKVIQDIFGQIQFKEKYLDSYFKDAEFWAVRNLMKQNICGISHYGGIKIYVDFDLVQNAGQQEEIRKFNHPIDFNNLSDYLELLVTLEHESIHNILRFFIKNKRFCLISPKYHTHLKYKDKPIEAGFFYELRAFNIIPQVEGPFCLNQIRK